MERFRFEERFSEQLGASRFESPRSEERREIERFRFEGKTSERVRERMRKRKRKGAIERDGSGKAPDGCTLEIL